MRRLILHVLLMMITFALGLGVELLITKREVKDASLPEKPLLTSKAVEADPPAVLASPVATLTANLIFDYDPLRFSPDGVYLINDKTPQDFREFYGFDLVWGDAKIPGYVGVQTYSNNVYTAHPAVFALVTERRLFFATSRSEAGFEYRFDGEFLRKDIASQASEGTTVLRGKLTKSKDGRKLAERMVDFRVEHDGC